MSEEITVDRSVQPEDEGKLTFLNDGKTIIEIDLKTGAVEVAEGYSQHQGAEMFWRAIHEFIRPKPNATIPLEPTETLKLNVDLPKQFDRVETGSIQFNEDWPGVFIRGDNAMWYGHNLERLLDDPKAFEQDEIGKALLRGLAKTLSGCRT